MIAALAVGRSDDGCGKCARVKGPKGSVRVKIMDSCASCSGDDIDLSMGAFKKIADLDVGRLDVTWKFVDC